MIRHKIAEKEHKNIHTQIVNIDKKKAVRVKRCLEAENLEQMSDLELNAWGFEKDWSELIFAVDFDDGALVSWHLRSGTNNYYDDVVFWAPKDGKHDFDHVDLDCSYELDDIEIETNNDIYLIKLVIS